MIEDVLLPRLGDMTEEVVILSWYVPVGAVVKAGDPLLRVETDKVEADVPAPADGRLVEIRAAEGAEVSVGQVIAVMEERC